MDKILLTDAQLKVLLMYIEQKGFSDPAIQLEILDHLACKVEEVLSSEQIILEEAVKKAHKSFGIAGFRPLAKSYSRHIYSKFKTWLPGALSSILFSVKILLPILAAIAGIGLYKQIYTGQIAFSFFTNPLNLLFGIGVLTEVFLLIKYWPEMRSIYYQGVSRRAVAGSFLWLFICINSMEMLSILGYGLASATIGILSFSFILYLQVKYQYVNYCLPEIKAKKAMTDQLKIAS